MFPPLQLLQVVAVGCLGRVLLVVLGFSRLPRRFGLLVRGGGRSRRCRVLLVQLEQERRRRRVVGEQDDEQALDRVLQEGLLDQLAQGLQQQLAQCLQQQLTQGLQLVVGRGPTGRVGLARRRRAGGGRFQLESCGVHFVIGQRGVCVGLSRQVSHAESLEAS